MTIHLFGIRHHGPGSARSLLAAFEELRPDCVLVEGPPEADPLIPHVADARLVPPVALLIHAVDQPDQAAFYPFALFSPEWQALRWAVTNAVPVRFCDLPQAHRLGLEAQGGADGEPEGEPGAEQGADAEGAAAGGEGAGDDTGPAAHLREDPLDLLARAAGHAEGERWWESLVEERRDGLPLFAAIAELMGELRRNLEPDGPRCPIEQRREAWMRRSLREAQKSGAQRIAVVCGAWHVPALAELPPAKGDNALLKGLPTVKTAAAWVPWSHGRLASGSGYGAGVQAPGWYHHLWSAPDRITSRWLAHAARCLREAGHDTSPAHLVEAVRLAEALAALRGRPLPGLDELSEAILSVLCFGDPVPLKLVEQRLALGERLGEVPESLPATPLQRDLTAQQKRLRMKPEAEWRELILDLRNATDLDRSRLLRRLRLLGVAWGEGGERAAGTGTFKERWKLAWKPDLAIRLVEAGAYGNSVEQAAAARAVQQAARAERVPELTGLAREVIYAGLDAALDPVLAALDARTALASDVTELMAALPELARLSRYGDVRGTAGAVVGQVIRHLCARIQAGLLLAAAGLDEEASARLAAQAGEVDAALALAELGDELVAWREALGQLLEAGNVHPLLKGRACRLLLDGGALAAEEAARRLGLITSVGGDPGEAAAWIEGFLGESASLLLHDDRLWALLDGWVSQLPAERFTTVLPLLRRSFSRLPAGERNALGRRVRSGPAPAQAAAVEFDEARAAAVLPLALRILGLEVPT